MVRLSAVLLCALIAVPLSRAHPVPQKAIHDTPAQASRSFRGMVFTVAHDELTLLTRGSTRQFKVGGDTLVVVNGTGGALKDVRPGYFAEVTAIAQGDKQKAQFIDAFIPR